MKKAIFSGSFDPFTLGHLDIVIRALKVFDKVIIAIAKSNSKKSYFSLSQRVKIAKKSLSKIDNVEIESFDGLLVDYLKSKDIDIIIRGIRNTTDYNYEVAMENANKALLSSSETIYFQTSDKYLFISSSIVRAILENNGDISNMVDKKALSYINKIRNKIEK